MKLVENNNSPTQNVLDIASDQSILSRYANFTIFAKTTALAFDPKQKQKLVSLLKRAIISQFKELVFIQFFQMEKTGQWGLGGEQQARTSFARKLLNLPSDKPLLSTHLQEAEGIIQEAKNKYDLVAAPESLIQTKFDDYTFKLMGQEFKRENVEKINQILRFFETNLHYYTTRMGPNLIYILAKYEFTNLECNDIYYFTEEIFRSPNTVMAMAASNNKNNIYLRKESLETIFFQKWVHAFKQSSVMQYDVQYDDFRNISEGIKKQCFTNYAINTDSELVEFKHTFIEDMKQTILYHEVGHIISLREILPFKTGAVSEASRYYGENILIALVEFLADFCPAYGEQKGAMQNMVDVAKKDPKRATAMFYMYFSDTWFFDTEDTYMYTYSDLLALILLKYINKDKTINWVLLESDIQFDRNAYSCTPNTMVERMMNLLEFFANEFLKIIQNYTLHFPNGETKDYQYLRTFTLNFLGQKETIDENDYTFLCKYWTYIITFCVKFTQDKAESLNKFLEKEEALTLKRMFILSAGKKKAEAYKYDHRAYIVDKCKELGLTLYDADDEIDIFNF